MIKAIAVLASGMWLLALVAAWDWKFNGNPTAPDGVLGAGIGALILTWVVWDLRRNDG